MQVEELLLQSSFASLNETWKSGNISIEVELNILITCVFQGCALGLGRLGLETSRDVARSRLGLVSEKFANVSISSRSRDLRSRSRLRLGHVGLAHKTIIIVFFFARIFHENCSEYWNAIRNPPTTVN